MFNKVSQSQLVLSSPPCLTQDAERQGDVFIRTALTSVLICSFLQGNITGLTGLMDFKDNGSNSHVQFEILGSSFSETFGKDIKRVSSHGCTFCVLKWKNRPRPM